MGLTLDPKQLIAGFRPALIKQALRHLERHGDPDLLGGLRSVFASRLEARTVYDACVSEGLVDPRSCRPTKDGEAFAHASLRCRTPATRAWELLDELLGWVDVYNKDPDHTRFVDQIWLFGSLMRGEVDVADVDLAIDWSHRPAFDQQWDLLAERIDMLCDRYGGPPYHLRFYQRGQWLFERSIFGPRRHPLFSGVQTNCSDLIAIGAPCQLIFDRVKGGRVDCAIVAHHPAADAN